jgi:uncharacterized circularly permuted ATP-grasp superfamily protein
MRGLNLPRNIYVNICGAGRQFARSQRVSYMLANRKVLKRVFPSLFRDKGVWPIDHCPQALLAILGSLSPENAACSNDPTTNLLARGVSNFAYFEHIMIALVRQLKIPCRCISGYFAKTRLGTALPRGPRTLGWKPFWAKLVGRPLIPPTIC